MISTKLHLALNNQYLNSGKVCKYLKIYYNDKLIYSKCEHVLLIILYRSFIAKK